MDKILEVSNLTMYQLFDSFSLTVEKNTFTVIIGPNMCGKTTLIKVLGGLIPTDEKVLLERCYLESMDPFIRYQKLAVVLSSPDAVFFFEKVEDELKFVLANLSLNEEETQKRFQKTVKYFSLSSLLGLRPKDLSRFHKVKLLLALAYIVEPKIILLDDPCRALDKEETRQILSYLLSLKKEGKTILMATDHLDECFEADRVVVLHQGQIRLDGTPLEVLKEDGTLNRIGLRLPFLVDLSVKLQYYNLIDTIYLDSEKLVDAVWKSE